MEKKNCKKNKKVDPVYYLVVGGMGILFFIFHTLSFFKGIFYSFTDWKGYGDWNFVGLRNYLHIFVDTDTLGAYTFTFKFAVITTILVNVISLVLATSLNGKIKFKNTIKAFYFLPYMLGSLIVGFIFNYIFANLLPTVGKALGISSLSSNILGTNYAIWGIIIVTVWSACAFNTLIYIAGLQSIDTDVYEAADLDGASGWKRFKSITFPLLAPSFTINMVLSAKGFLMVYDQIMAMTDGGPGMSTTSIAVLIYKKGFGGGQFAYQSANAVVLFIIVVAISIFQLRMLEKREERIG
jgi:raffinose/stachyose/melibiose transport system permease protein